MIRVVILGSRDLGQQMALHLRRAGGFEVTGFLDDFRTAGEQTPHGRVLGRAGDAERLHLEGACDAAMVGVGYNHLEARGRMLAALRGRVPLATFVHEEAWVDPSACIEEGSFLMPGCIVDSGVRVGCGAFLNLGCVVSHDSTVGVNCFLAPRVTIAGFTQVGDGCFLGAGTTVIERVRLAPGVCTGAGAVVVGDLAEAGLYVGVPARRLR